MIHYHGTPITPRAQLMRMAGRHFCVSFARPDDLKTCMQIGQSVMFDNGAFSTHTRGEVFDVAAYYAWLEPILTHPHWAVIPDVIGGDELSNWDLAMQWPADRRQFGAPVWHMNLDIDYLLRLCGLFPRVCIGSSAAYWKVGSPTWSGRMDEAFNALAKRFNPLPWVHGLRMLGQVDGGWPLASADSTNVAQNFKRDSGCAECKAGPIDARQPAPTWIERGVQAPMLY